MLLIRRVRNCFQFSNWRTLLATLQYRTKVKTNEPVSAVIGQYEKTLAADLKQKVAQCRFVVIDLETTGLHAKTDYIVSVGWVVIEAQELLLAQSKHYLIASPVSVGQSAVYHGVHDHDLKKGHELNEVLVELFNVAAGAVLVAHHANIEQQFLTVACQRLYGKAPKLRFVDTMALEWQRLHQQGKVLKQRDLQLNACLERYHLPTSQQHHALADAFSCALLLLCQLKQSREPDRTLADLYKMARM